MKPIYDKDKIEITVLEKIAKEQYEKIRDRIRETGILFFEEPEMKVSKITIHNIDESIEPEGTIFTKEDNLYYLPSINEFYLGFEYEVLTSTPVKDYMDSGEEFTGYIYEWIPQVCESSPVPLSAIRVKYLDREDIESLGFKQTHEYNKYKSYKYEGRINTYFLRYHDNHIYSIYDEDSQYYFFGKIKNKSELKKILEQIDIKN